MSKRALAWGSIRFATRRFVALSMALTAALGAAVVAGGPAYASGQYCASDSSFNVCTSVNGQSNVINTATGSATTKSAIEFADLAGTLAPVDGHVQLISPTGATLCNSTTKLLSSSGINLSCTWNGGGVARPTGNYCTIVWVYVWLGPSWGYRQVGPTDCLYVFTT